MIQSPFLPQCSVLYYDENINATENANLFFSYCSREFKSVRKVIAMTATDNTTVTIFSLFAVSSFLYFFLTARISNNERKKQAGTP